MKTTILKKSGLFILIGLHAIMAYSQEKDMLSSKEKAYYNTIKDLCHYLEHNPDPLKNRDLLLNKWIYFDYVLKDTVQERKDKRIEQLDQLLVEFKHFLDSVGIENLDACPIRYYKDSKDFFKPFTANLANQIQVTFAYFNKNDPEHPIGYLLFDDKTGKLVSWILIDQGGYFYFLTFNQI